MNNALGTVIGERWVNREVLENGIIRNTYEDGTEIIINYTSNEYDYSGTTVGAESYEVVGE